MMHAWVPNEIRRFYASMHTTIPTCCGTADDDAEAAEAEAEAAEAEEAAAADGPGRTYPSSGLPLLRAAAASAAPEWKSGLAPSRFLWRKNS